MPRVSRTKSFLAWVPLAVVGASLAPAARAQPPPGGGPTHGARPSLSVSVDALRFDVERIVEAEENGGWFVDEVAVAAVFGDVMASVCSATPNTRRSVLHQLEMESEALGDPRQLYVRAGSTMNESVERALTARRLVVVMRRAVAAAPRECPFWVRPDPEFRGLQSTRDRFVLTFDTGGLVQLRRTEGKWALGAGGSGRVLLGYSFTNVSVLCGIEFGGGALLEPDTDPTEFRINYLPALPLVLRVHQRAWHYDFELTPVALFQAGNETLSYGLRGAMTVGLSALRVRGILPWVGIGVAAEHYFPGETRPRATYLRGGLRVGGVFAPSD